MVQPYDGLARHAVVVIPDHAHLSFLDAIKAWRSGQYSTACRNRDQWKDLPRSVCRNAESISKSPGGGPVCSRVYLAGLSSHAWISKRIQNTRRSQSQVPVAAHRIRKRFFNYYITCIR